MRACKRACIRMKSSMGNTLLEFGRPEDRLLLGP